MIVRISIITIIASIAAMVKECLHAKYGIAKMHVAIMPHASVWINLINNNLRLAWIISKRPRWGCNTAWLMGVVGMNLIHKVTTLAAGSSGWLGWFDAEEGDWLAGRSQRDVSLGDDDDHQ